MKISCSLSWYTSGWSTRNDFPHFPQVTRLSLPVSKSVLNPGSSSTSTESYNSTHSSAPQPGHAMS